MLFFKILRRDIKLKFFYFVICPKIPIQQSKKRQEFYEKTFILAYTSLGSKFRNSKYRIQHGNYKFWKIQLIKKISK